VRNLQREIGNLARKAVYAIAGGEARAVHVTQRNLAKYAGVARYRRAGIEPADAIGTVTGLAWTAVGGELLTIEAVMVPGTGKVTATGKLGEVMRESIEAAQIYVKARAEALGVDPERLAKRNLHLHLPEGAVPKDGPSAGLAMVTALVSCLNQRAVRRDVAMTGEMTLRGRVLAIGGLKEKLLAAQRAGVRTVLIPEDNAAELVEIPESVRRGLEIVPVKRVEEALARAIVALPESVADAESQDLEPVVPPLGPGETPGMIRH
jgi:ATP-dependent Lon protease